MSKTVTGNWLYPNGCPVANGVVFFSLSADAALTATGGAVAPKLIQASLNASGSVSATLLANDELVPSGSQYTVSVNMPGGGRIYGPEIYSITGASPINLNALTPVAAGGPFFPTPIVATPTGTQTITAFPLIVRAPSNPANPLYAANAAGSFVAGFNVDASGNGYLGVGNAAQTLFINLPAATATAATAGSVALPASPAGFIVFSINGVAAKVPYYNA